MLWQKTYGDAQNQKATSIVQTDSSHFLVGVPSALFGDNSVMKIDSSGNIDWKKNFGSNNGNTIEKILQTNDNNYLVLGTTSSTSGPIQDTHGSNDVFLAKISDPKPLSNSPVEATINLQNLDIDSKTKLAFSNVKVTFADPTLNIVSNIDISADVSTLQDNPSNSNKESGGLILQVGANSGQIMVVNIDSMKADDLGLVDGTPNVMNNVSANSSISALDTAIEKVSSGRSSLGAKQNALEHIISNVNNSSENLTSAESRIRDADIAKEVFNLSKNNILLQATQAMLSQANQIPERVLQLFKN